MLADIQQKTTCSPIVYSDTIFSTATTFSPQALRDTNSSPDLGYHYDPLDYAFGGCEAANNLIFSAGTAVGWFRTTSGWQDKGYGIYIHNLQTVAFQGTATAWCYWTRLNAVQEQDLTAQCGPGGLDGEDNQYGQDISQSPIVQANFLRSTLMAAENGNCLRDDYGYLIVNANNSEFYIGSVGGYGLSMSLTNCLFERSGVGNMESWPGNFANVENCTFNGGSLSFYGGQLTHYYWATSMPINVNNCSFDGTSFANAGYATDTNYVSYDYNAYTNSSNPYGLGGAHDVIVTNGFNWQSSWLGNYYLPSDSLLIDAGSTTADQVGLYHFTTQTNQTIEGGSPVDIGYHYVAVDGNGNPLDSNGDGISDYIEDANGNGLVDNGETPWMPPPTFITQPVSQSVVQGSNATFSTTVTSLVPVGYQWYFNTNTLVVNATNSTLTLTSVQTTNGGNYCVTVTNPAGSVTSTQAILAVIVPPVITIQPTNESVVQGNNTNFSVTVTSLAPVGYQWYFNTNTLLINATNSTLNLTNVQTTNGGSYCVVVTNIVGSVASSNAVLTVYPMAPVGLTATGTNLLVNLSWSAVSGVTSYNVKRATVSGGPYTTIQSGVTTNAYADVVVTNGIMYYYVVSALNVWIEGGNSAEVGAEPHVNLYWTGITTNSWNINTTTNWRTGSLAVTYLNTDDVILDDTASNTSLVISVTVNPNSVTVNNTNKNYTISGSAIAGSAALTKTGPGTLTLANTNTYTGLTTVSNGTLLVNGMTGTNLVMVATGATLGGTGILNGPVTVAAGGTLAPGGLGTIGKLTLTNSSATSLTLNGNDLAFILVRTNTPGTTYNQIAVTGGSGTLILNGANYLQLNSTTGTITNGIYTLLTYASKSGSGTLTFLNGSLTNGNLALTIGTTSVTLNVSANTAVGTNLTWKGNVSGQWDKTTTNWVNGISTMAYSDGNNVTFDDTAAGNFAISGGAVTPGSVTFNDSVQNYSVSAGIAGSGLVSKYGLGTLTLSGTNTYSGGTVVNGGELVGVTGGSCSNSSLTVWPGATNGVQVLAAGGRWACGGLTNLSGSWVDFNFGSVTPSTTTAPLLVVGNLSFTNGANIIVRNNGATLNVGQYPLIKYGTLSGTVPNSAFSVPTLAAGASAAIINNTGNKSIDLAVTVGNTLNWAVGNGSWDINLTANWQNSGVSGFTYQDGRAVVLDDTASGASPILVTNTVMVSPAGVTANLTNKNYSLYGNAIAGASSLTLNGSGTLTLLNNNSYSGGTTISGGTLQLGDGTANNGAVAGNITDNATLAIANPNAQTINSVISGTGAMTKSGSGTLTLIGTNTYSGNTTINAGTLLVTNGGAINSPTATLNIGAQGGKTGTNTLANGGVITVGTLLATNVVTAGTTTNYSFFNFNGGTLTTSNNNGIAASILLASNTSWTINGNWNLNGGTNFISDVATNSNPTNYVYVGNGSNNVRVNVNANAVWAHIIPTNSTVTNVMGLVIGNGNATNNVFTVNSGTLIVTNRPGATIPPITIGNNTGSIGNQLIITNGGKVFSSSRGDYGTVAGQIGNYGYNNSAIVAGTNASGQKATWNLGKDRLVIGASATSNSWVRVDQGGVITNCQVYEFNNSSSLFITNGGQVFANAVTVGRSGFNNSLIVGGVDVSGNPATLAFYTTTAAPTLTIGGGSVTAATPGTNNTVRVDVGGLVTNVGSVYVGGASTTWDSNCIANVLIITNGGQVFSTNSCAIGLLNGCNSNSLSLGGGSGVSLWNLNNQSLTIGNNALASNNYVTLFGGGVLTNVSTVTLGGGYTKLNFNGGTLAAGANGNLIVTNSTTVKPTNYVQAGGAVINDGGFTVTNILPMLQDPNSTGGGLTKFGNGTLTLLGVNTYTGPTTISAGTLMVNSNVTINTGLLSLNGGTLSNNISCILTNTINLNAASTLGVAGGQTLTLSGVMTNGSNLTIAGGGTLILNGNGGAATGSILVTNNAVLGGTGIFGGSVVLAAGSSLVPGGLNAVGTFTFGNNLTLNGNTLFFNLYTNTAATNDLVIVGNSLAVNGTNTVQISISSSIPAGSYTLMTFANGYTGSGNFVLAGNNSYYTNNATLVMNSTSLVLQVGAGGIVYADVWKGYVNGTWDISVLNWANNNNPVVAFTNNDAVVFDDTLAGNPTITNATPGATVSPASMTFYNNLTNYKLNVTIAGSGLVSKYGLGTLTLSGTNTYSGGTVVNGGELVGVTGGSCSNSSLTVWPGATNGVQVLAAGGRWACGGLTNLSGSWVDFNFGSVTPSTTTAPLLVVGNLSFTNGANIIVRNNGATLNVGQYPLIKYGTLSGTVPNSAFSVPTLAAGASAAIINNTGNKSIDLAVTVGNTLNWAVGNGSWDINLTANWQNSGVSGFTYQDGRAVVLDDTASGASPILVTNTVMVSPAGVTANLTNKNYSLYGNAIAGASSLTLNGSGTLTLLNNNSYSGGTTISGGTLQLGDGTANNGAVAGNITDNATLAIANPNAQTINSVISGTGAMTKSGSGTLTLIGTNTYNGNTTINGGTLQFGDGTANNGVVAGNITDNAILAIANPNAQTISNIISGTGLLTKLGSGTLTLSGTNTYSGVTAVNGGELVGVTGGSCSNSALTVWPGATNGVQVLAAGGRWPCGGQTNLSGSWVDFNIGSVTPSTTTAPLLVVGNLSFTNGVNIIVRNNGATLNVGQYPLIKYGTLSGTVPNSAFSLPTLAAGASAVIINNAGNKSIDLVVTVGSTLNWAVGNGSWDINLNANWQNSGVSGFTYQDAKAVVLDDTASGASPILVTNTVTVSPAGVTANLTNKNYSLYGNAIAGAGSLTLNGLGTLTLLNNNSYSGGTTINGGTLTVTNGGVINSPNATLLVNTGTNTLANGGAITIGTLLSTNVVLAGGVSSIFNFNGGTLTTSNNNGLAANILVASNTAYNVSGNWNMFGGTNYVTSVQTSGVFNGVTLGKNASNTVVTVANAVLSLANPNAYVLSPTNLMSLYVGNGVGSNNVLNITNGGQIYCGAYNGSGLVGLGLGVTANNPNNGVIVASTNGAGQKSSLDLGGSRLYIGDAGSIATNDWALVDGGVITNVGGSQGCTYTLGVGSFLVITNGGQILANGGNSVVGRTGLTNYWLVAGADSAGNPATFNGGRGVLQIGGVAGLGDSAYSGTNNWLWVGQGGLVTNLNSINVGGDTNALNNGMIIINGGQVFTAGTSLIGYQNSANNNYVSLGGGTNSSLWNLGNASLTIGGTALASNNYVTLFAGGVMTNVSSVVLGGVNSLLNFNGGMLAAGANGNLIATNSTSVNAINYVQAGGAIINDNGYMVTSQLPLLQDLNSTGGGLTKLGSGRLTLLNINNYAGPTMISAGTLALSGNASIGNSSSIAVAGGAGLDVSGLNTGFSLVGGQTLINSTVGAILNGNLDCSSGVVSLVYDGTNASFTITNGTLTLSAGTVFNLNYTGAILSPGSYEIIANATAGNAGWVAGMVPTNVTFTGTSVAGTLSLQIVNGGLYLDVGNIMSTIAYGPTVLTYCGSAQGPTISFSGSTGAKTTNYVGIGATTYASVNAPTNVGTYYVSNTVAADTNYFAAINSTVFTINPTATVSFSTNNSGLVLNPAFCGLSYEKSKLTGSLFVSTDISLINMFSQIAPAVLRLGGNSVDTTCWGGLSNQTAITTAQVDAFAGFVKALPTNWHVIYGINLASNTPANCAAEAAYVANKLGSSLLGFEIGNEPDDYSGNGITNYTQFLAQWRTFAAAITNAVPGWANTNGGNGWTLTGPVSGGNTTGYTMPFATNEAGVISLVTQHYYRGDGQSTNSTMALLLSPDPSLPGAVSNIVAAATANHLPFGFRMAECGSFYHGGNTVSAEYGAALWTLDFMFTIAINGGQGVNFHGGGGGFNSYTPIADNGAAVVMARPEFYGLKLFSLASLGGGGFIPATNTVGTNFNFTAYGVQQTAGVFGAVLINKETNYSIQVTINLGSNVVAMSSMMLSGQALSSTNGYTLGGAVINANGSWTGGFQSMTLVTNGQLTVTVPPISALWLNPITVGTNTPPIIITQPTNQTIVQSGNLIFSVTAIGTAPLNYQWWFNGSNLLAGATNPLLTITNVQATNAGSYFVVVSNVAGGVTSSIATLTGMSWTMDSDYDGRSDAQELLDGTDPFNPNSVLRVRLGYWNFDNTNTWVGNAGQLPLLATNVVGVSSWATNAVLIDSINAASLTYRDVETNGNANINLGCGTIRFWFKPDWSSVAAGGTGPGSAGRLIELGNQAATNGWWAMVLSPDGNQLTFGTQTNGLAMTNLTTTINWVSNQWHQVVLTYSPANSTLYMDSLLVTNGLGPVFYPNATERAGGFRIGSDGNGNNQARGAFDELETFNYPLGAGAILGNTNGITFWWEVADSNNQVAGILSVWIDIPTKGAVLQ